MLQKPQDIIDQSSGHLRWARCSFFCNTWDEVAYIIIRKITLPSTDTKQGSFFFLFFFSPLLATFRNWPSCEANPFHSVQLKSELCRSWVYRINISQGLPCKDWPGRGDKHEACRWDATWRRHTEQSRAFPQGSQGELASKLDLRVLKVWCPWGSPGSLVKRETGRDPIRITWVA